MIPIILVLFRWLRIFELSIIICCRLLTIYLWFNWLFLLSSALFEYLLALIFLWFFWLFHFFRRFLWLLLFWFFRLFWFFGCFSLSFLSWRFTFTFAIFIIITILLCLMNFRFLNFLSSSFLWGCWLSFIIILFLLSFLARFFIAFFGLRLLSRFLLYLLRRLGLLYFLLILIWFWVIFWFLWSSSFFRRCVNWRLLFFCLDYFFSLFWSFRSFRCFGCFWRLWRRLWRRFRWGFRRWFRSGLGFNNNLYFFLSRLFRTLLLHFFTLFTNRFWLFCFFVQWFFDWCGRLSCTSRSALRLLCFRFWFVSLCFNILFNWFLFGFLNRSFWLSWHPYQRYYNLINKIFIYRDIQISDWLFCK